MTARSPSTDLDVIKTCVELGLGVGIAAAIVFEDERDLHVRAIDARHPFAANMTRLAIRRGSDLRDHFYEFITAFAPPLTRALVQRALQSAPGKDFDIQTLAGALAPPRLRSPPPDRPAPGFRCQRRNG